MVSQGTEFIPDKSREKAQKLAEEKIDLRHLKLILIRLLNE